MWRTICCCCSWCGGGAAYSALDGSSEGAAGVGSRSNSPKQRAAHAHARDAAHAPFEIEIDDKEEEDDDDHAEGGDADEDAAFFEERPEADAADEDVEAMLQLELAPSPSGRHRGDIELAAVSRVPTRKTSPGVRTPILPSYHASPPASTAAAALSGNVTRADLEAVEDDEDLLRFRRALEQAESVAHPSRPAAVALPSPPPSSASRLSSTPSVPTIPKVIRKSPDNARSQPTTPFADLATLQLQSLAQQVQQQEAHQQQQHQQSQSHPPVPGHAPLIHSPSAPALSTTAAINAFPQPALPVTQSTHPAPIEPATSPSPAHTPAVAPAPAVAKPASKPSSHTQPTAAAAAVAPTPASAASAASSASNASSNPLDRLQVPAGPISLAHMEELMSMLTHTSVADVSYAHLFSFLASASRTLAGKVIRPFVLPQLQAIIEAASRPHLKRSSSAGLAPLPNGHSAPPSAAKGGFSPEAAKLLVQFVQWLEEVRVDAAARTLHVRFDFGGGGSQKYTYIDMPSQDTWVLSSKHTADPFLVHPANQPKIYRNESHRLCIHRDLSMAIDQRGVLSLRSGDVSIKKFVSFNAELRTEFRPGMVEYDNARNAFIAMDARDETKPLIIDGHYQPRTFDYWLVITVLKQENWIGLPTIGPQHPPDLKMKPHEGYPYP